MAGPDDAKDLRRVVPDILDTVERMLGQVQRGALGSAPPGRRAGYVRAGWL